MEGLPIAHFAAAAGVALVIPLTLRWRLAPGAACDISTSRRDRSSQGAGEIACVSFVRLKVAGTSRALRQRGGASEGALAIGRHDRLRGKRLWVDGPRLGNAGERRSDFGDVDDRLGKGLRGFLRQVVPNAARDEPVLISTGELAAISRGFRMGRAVGVAFHSDSQRITASFRAA